MKTRLRFGIKPIIVTTAFVAMGCMWWLDYQLLSDRLLDEQEMVDAVTQENAALRQSVRSAQADTDELFAHTIAQTDAINQLKTVSEGLKKRVRSTQ